MKSIKELRNNKKGLSMSSLIRLKLNWQIQILNQVLGLIGEIERGNGEGWFVAELKAKIEGK